MRPLRASIFLKAVQQDGPTTVGDATQDEDTFGRQRDLSKCARVCVVLQSVTCVDNVMCVCECVISHVH